jgi:hypothetical protein
MRNRNWSLCARLPLMAAAVLVTAASARCDGPAYHDPAEARAAEPGFAIQGEYLGRIEDEDGERTKVGVQVIGRGGGDFDAVAYPGGLPGRGAEFEERIKLKVSRNDEGVLRLIGDQHVGLLRDGSITVRNRDGGGTVGTLEKVQRESPTLGKEPPEGAVVLFDGSEASMKHWKDGKLTENGLLKEGALTARKFGDHTLHVEFRLPYMPKARGQSRGNSGLYLFDRYEAQMLDSFGLEGKHNECGAFYKFKTPDVNMCYPPLRWQTYDVEFTAPRFDEDGNKVRNARVTVRHNGVVIHDDVELPQGTGAGADKPEIPRGRNRLQDHGDPVRYRNIWAVPHDASE